MACALCRRFGPGTQKRRRRFTATTKGRFLQTQFQLLNLSSGKLGYEGVTLRDSRGQGYRHFGERLEFIDDNKECPPSLFPPNRHPIEPNTPTICTTIHEVAKDAKNLTLLASDLEGYETGFVALPNVKTPTPTQLRHQLLRHLLQSLQGLMRLAKTLPPESTEEKRQTIHSASGHE